MWQPEKNQTTTGEGFAAFRRKLFRKRILTVLIAVVLTAALLISMGVVAHQVPLVNITEQELTVLRAYRYEVNGEQYFFVLYEIPAYTGYTNGKFEILGDEKIESGPLTIQLQWKKTILARQLDWTSTDFWIFSAEGMNAQKEDSAIEQLRFSDQLLWSAEEDSREIVPEYVYQLHDFFATEADGQVRAFFAEKGHLGVFQEDGRRTVWDLDGNVLSDSYSDENGIYPEY